MLVRGKMVSETMIPDSPDSEMDDPEHGGSGSPSEQGERAPSVSVGKFDAAYYAGLLAHWLETEGPQEKGVIRSWLTEQGVLGGYANMVMGQGMKRGDNRWHEAPPGSFTYGPKPGTATRRTRPDPNSIPGPAQVAAMASSQDKFAAIIVSLGIDAVIAKTTANYCFANYDMADPERAWQALRECTNVVPTDKKRIWRTWLSLIQVEPPDTLAERVAGDYSPATRPGAQVTPPALGATIQRYYVHDGALYPAEPGDLTAYTWGQGMMMLAQQSKERKEETAMVPVPNNSGAELLAPVVDLIKTMFPDKDGNSTALALSMETERREMAREARETERAAREHEMAMERESRQHDMEMMRMQHEMSMKTVTDAISELAGALNGQSKSPFAALDAILPGASTKIVTMLLGDGNNDKIPQGFLGGFDTTNMSVDTAERLSELEIRRQNGDLMRKSVPEFISLGRDFLGAFNRMSAREDQEELQAKEAAKDDQLGPAAPNPEEDTCSECKAELELEPGVAEPQCPTCFAIRAVDGIWYPEPSEPVEYEETPVSQETESVPTQDAPEDLPPRWETPAVNPPVESFSSGTEGEAAAVAEALVPVSCPSCKAEVGEPCRTPGGDLSAQPHKARYDAALKAGEAAQMVPEPAEEPQPATVGGAV